MRGPRVVSLVSRNKLSIESCTSNSRGEKLVTLADIESSISSSEVGGPGYRGIRAVISSAARVWASMKECSCIA